MVVDGEYAILLTQDELEDGSQENTTFYYKRNKNMEEMDNESIEGYVEDEMLTHIFVILVLTVL